MNNVLRLLYAPYKYLVFIPLAALSTMVFGSLAVCLMYVSRPRFVSSICGVYWARFNSLIAPMLLQVIGRENIDPKQSYVICANHQSQFDIFVIYGWIGVDFKWVMKKELRKVPFLGAACERLEHIYIDRSNREAALRSLKEAKKRIVNGTSVMFFPEGTRSAVDEMLPFKKGAFVMALDLGLPILPVSIVGTRKILPTRSLKLFPGRAKMLIHPPISTAGYSEASLPELMETVRRTIQAGLDGDSGPTV